MLGSWELEATGTGTLRGGGEGRSVERAECRDANPAAAELPDVAADMAKGLRQYLSDEETDEQSCRSVSCWGRYTFPRVFSGACQRPVEHPDLTGAL